MRRPEPARRTRTCLGFTRFNNCTQLTRIDGRRPLLRAGGPISYVPRLLDVLAHIASETGVEGVWRVVSGSGFASRVSVVDRLLYSGFGVITSGVKRTSQPVLPPPEPCTLHHPLFTPPHPLYSLHPTRYMSYATPHTVRPRHYNPPPRTQKSSQFYMKCALI